MSNPPSSHAGAEATRAPSSSSHTVSSPAGIAKQPSPTRAAPPRPSPPPSSSQNPAVTSRPSSLTTSQTASSPMSTATVAKPPPVPPIPSSPPKFGPRSWFFRNTGDGTVRPRTSPGPRASALKGKGQLDESARHSGSSSGGNQAVAEVVSSGAARTRAGSNAGSLKKTPSLSDLPKIVVHGDEEGMAHAGRGNFVGLNMDIPTGGIEELEFGQGKLEFSNRGSLLMGGKRVRNAKRKSKINGSIMSMGSHKEEDEGEQERMMKELKGIGEREDARAESTIAAAPSGETQTETLQEQGTAQGQQPHETTQGQAQLPETALPSSPPQKISSPQSNEMLSPPPPISPTTSDHLSPTKVRTRNGPLPRSGAHQGSRVLSADETLLSLKVRSMYEYGDECAADWITPEDLEDEYSGWSSDDSHDHPSSPTSTCPSHLTPHGGNRAPGRRASTRSLARAPSLSTLGSRRPSTATVPPKDHGPAGGLEDWEDISPEEVDRYGFIVHKKAPSGPLSPPTSPPPTGAGGSGPGGLQRVSTALQLVSETPRRKPSVLRRAVSSRNRPGSPRSIKPQPSIYSYRSTRTTSSVARSGRALRAAANRLPHNRDRRIVEEAADMLTLPPGLEEVERQRRGSLAGIREEEKRRRRERRREAKWAAMAKLATSAGGQLGKGAGMEFDFDTADPKLVSRTWKGIPDRWRGVAWHAFLSASARKRGGRPGQPAYVSDERLAARYRELQARPSKDDVQIDVDVPRTVGGHVLFRKRYRGGQRLLFRVLHAMSLYFPETGYVQGMAALAATLLGYYDEERAFVMLVRLWQLRGLERLYSKGFGGLMEGLEEFERDWLKGTGSGSGADGEVGRKLEELGITPTAYGTRWYLTLFNYSIPFPAQLRVWDVFMLLGDPPDIPSNNSSSPSSTTAATTPSSPNPSSAHHHHHHLRLRRHSTTPSSPDPDRSVSDPGPGASPVVDAEADAEADTDADADGLHGAKADLSVLHAAAKALVDATSEVLLEGDFENAMKVLTSWIPVRDEDLLMRVAWVEWRRRRRRGRGVR